MNPHFILIVEFFARVGKIAGVHVASPWGLQGSVTTLTLTHTACGSEPITYYPYLSVKYKVNETGYENMSEQPLQLIK